MNIHIQNCSTWLINLHSRQNGGDDCVNRQTRVRYNLPGRILVLRENEDRIFLAFFPLVDIGP